MDPPQFSSSTDDFHPVYGGASGSAYPVKEKKSKSKKHKKHHKHDRHAAEKADEAGSLKIKIRVGGAPGGPPEAGADLEGAKMKKKKKKKDKKKKDKEKKHRHHHKEKRKENENQQSQDKMEVEPEPEFNKMDDQEVKQQEMKAEEMEHDGETPQMSAPEEKPFHKFLRSILVLLEKRDPNNFFAMPVSDQFAPGYSQIIRNPMDFSTMRGKVSKAEYPNIDAFKQDFEQMCSNAMTYNTQETIYYKTAKKLLAFGKRIINPQRIRKMAEQMSFVREIGADELGFDVNVDGDEDEEDEEDEDEDEDEDDVSKVIEDIREVVRRPPGRFEAIPDDMTSQEILENAKAAAKAAGDKLKIYRPKSQMGFLRHKPDGSTSLSFLTGSDGIVPGTEKDRPVSLGELIGKVKQGTGAIQGFKEDRRNLAKTVHPLYYGAFSSHGPTYDSTFANLTKEETDLVYSTYGDGVGVQYAESILNFSRNCDYAMFIVDHLLDILTDKAHRATSNYIEEKKRLRKEDEVLDSALKEVESSVTEDKDEKQKVDFESLKSLSNDGIDMSFLDDVKTWYESHDPKKQLDTNAELIDKLKEIQTQRLSRPTPQHFAQMPGPEEPELELAAKVQANLSEMTKQLCPADVVPEETVQKLLGIPVKPKKEEFVVSESGRLASLQPMEVVNDQ